MALRQRSAAGVVFDACNSAFLVVGTTVNILLTSFAAYVRSRRNVYWKPMLMIMAVVTLLFERGLVPSYLTGRGFGLLNSPIRGAGRPSPIRRIASALKHVNLDAARVTLPDASDR